MIYDILDHIEASAPCSLFSVAAWAQDQLDISPAGYLAAIEQLIASGVIEVTQETSDSGSMSFVVDLV